jgi:hypothetical protein
MGVLAYQSFSSETQKAFLNMSAGGKYVRVVVVER